MTDFTKLAVLCDILMYIVYNEYSFEAVGCSQVT